MLAQSLCACKLFFEIISYFLQEIPEKSKLYAMVVIFLPIKHFLAANINSRYQLLYAPFPYEVFAIS